MKDLVEPESNKATMTSLVSKRCISLIAVKITGAKSSSRSAPFSSCSEGVVTQNDHVLDIIRPQLLRQNQSNDCRHEPDWVDKLEPDRWYQDLSNDISVQQPEHVAV
eukprot:scaffold77552_cov45-Attheya_sp.AAC.1